MARYENDLARACIDLIAVCGGFAWRQNTGAGRMASGRFMRFGEPGVADVIGVLRRTKRSPLEPADLGVFIAVECKGPNTRQSPAQRAWQREIEQRDGVYVLARTLKDLEDRLKELGVMK